MLNASIEGLKMGTKRPLDEDLEEFSFRRPKNLDNGDKLTFSRSSPSYDASQKLDMLGETDGNFHKIHYGEGLRSDDLNFASDLAENSTSGGGEGSPECLHFNFPRQTLVRFVDFYSYLLNYPPQKEVPIGSDYQAEVPFWDLGAKIKECPLSSTSMVDGKDELKLMGTCVIPSPDVRISAYDGVAGYGRTDCDCPDEGSVRCVEQHVHEGRENLREKLGHEKFMDLGFLVMGEVVANEWTEEEEKVFHEVVYSHPVSLGKNFWEYLPSMFPSRTMKGLVSYYFNVFMLRKRAVQNRSNFLEIDSDDDEWQGDGEPSELRGDVDPAFPAFVDQNVSLHHESDSVHENRDNGFDQCDDSLHKNGNYNLDHQDYSVDKKEQSKDNDGDGNYGNKDDCQGNGYMGVGGKYAPANDDGTSHMSGPRTGKSIDDNYGSKDDCQGNGDVGIGGKDASANDDGMSHMSGPQTGKFTGDSTFDDNYGSKDDCQGNSDMRVGQKDTSAKDDGMSSMSEPQTGKSFGESSFDGRVNHVENFSGKICGKLDVQGLQPADGHDVATDVCGPAGTTAGTTQEIKDEKNLRKRLHGNSHGSNGAPVSGYILEPCDAKVWESSYSVSSTKGVDLLPTCEMIEELFGPSS